MKLNRLFITFLLTVPIVLMNCKKESRNVASELNGNWIVTSYNDHNMNSSITKSQTNTWSDFNNGDITVTFTSSSNNYGIIAGTNVTNQFSGEYSINSKNKIAINKFITTEINEPEWSTLFHQINKAEDYILSEGKLTIYYNQKKNSITLEKQ